MADDRFITAPLQNLVQIVLGGTETSGATRGTPQALVNLAAGTLLTGTVVSRDEKGNPLLRTTQGDITLHRSHFLQTGSKVVLRVEHSGAQFQARIVSVDGVPIEKLQSPGLDDITDVVVTRNNPAPSNAPRVPVQPEAQAYNRPAPDVIQKQEIAAETSYRNLDKGSVVTARLTRTEPGALEILRSNFEAAGKATDSLPPRLDPGTTLTLRVLTNQPPAPYTPPQGAPVANAPAPQAQIPTPLASPVQQPLPAQGTTATVVTTEISAPLPATATGTAPSPAASRPEAPVIAPGNTAAAPTPQQSAQPLAAASLATTVTSARPETVATPTAGTPAAASARPAAPIPANAGVLISAAAPPPSSSARAIAIPATITGTDAATGERIALTPLGNLRLPADIAVPPNTKLTVQVLSTTPGAPSYAIPVEGEEAAVTSASIASRTTPATVTELATRWDSLKELYTLLQTHQPELAARLLQGGAIPRADASLTSSTLFFMVALGSGDVRKWLGNDVVQMLEDSGKGNLLHRLGAEFGAIRQAFTQAPGQNWQTLLFPVFDGHELQQARMFIKRDPEEHKKDGKKRSGGTRVVVEVNLTQMGEVQLDGLYKEQKNTKSFDLMVRSLRALGKDVRESIAQIFRDSLLDSPIAGTVSFQAVQRFPLDPMQEVALPATEAVVV
ncbi:MAG: hypothetical protein IT567_07340 [Alphaproteobacteria bacterium]|nr:hypothetical protein [Alphaproteobacteria bacterium]